MLFFVWKINTNISIGSPYVFEHIFYIGILDTFAIENQLLFASIILLYFKTPSFEYLVFLLTQQSLLFKLLLENMARKLSFFFTEKKESKTLKKMFLYLR